MIRFLILILSFFSLTAVAQANDTPCTEHECIAVIDAGSTGSRLHIFAYDKDSTNTPVHIQEAWSKRIKPGFATLEPNDKNIENYLSGLLSDSPIHHIPVYFYATAGMRLLPSSKQKTFYTSLTQWFSKHPEWHLMQAKTITGNDEALFDWIAVNYHLDNFNAPSAEPVGVMDMGGASVQIVFAVDNVESLKGESKKDLNLYGKTYHLYAHSFLGLGQTEVSHQFLNVSSCFAHNYPLPDGDSGHGSAANCEHEISALMNSVHGVNQLIQPILAANPVNNWYGIGGISYFADNSLFHFQNHEFTNESLLNQADSEICQQQWEDLNNKFPNDDFTSQYCLLSSYYYALMVDGYGLIPQQNIRYIAAQENLDWTLGVVLYH